MKLRFAGLLKELLDGGLSYLLPVFFAAIALLAMLRFLNRPATPHRDEHPPQRALSGPSLSKAVLTQWRTPANTAPGKAGPKKRPWDPSLLASLNAKAKGDAIQFELVDGQRASGTIGFLQATNNQVIYVSGLLTQPEPGRFFFQKQSLPGVAGGFVGVVEFPATGRAYRVEPAGPGSISELVERGMDDVLCLKLPKPADQGTDQVAEIPPLKPGDYPDLPIPPYQNGILVLQSLPGATAVVYLDYQGGHTPTWGGISYERPKVSNEEIRDVWLRVAEDFMPFNINVTTDLEVFQSAPANSRQRVIVTPTETAAPGAGGVAYVGSFTWTGDIPCWIFILSGKDCAEACSHEVGHTLGLYHQGLHQGETYYDYCTGHGVGETSWAPLMGVGYYRNVSQWSRGEYSFANNTEDELAIITTANNNVDYRPDDTGNTLADSRSLEIYSNYTASAEGVIERTEDTDAFQFTTDGGAVSLRADPVGAGPNLALSVALYDANDTLLGSNNPQETLWASLDTNLPAGTYTFHVTGAGRKDPLTDGFSSYASLGYYSITGFVANAHLPDRFVLREASPKGTVVGIVQPAHTNGHVLAYAIVAGNTGNTFAIDDFGTLTVADSSLLDYDALARSTQLAVQFELFVHITDTQDSSLNEPHRRVVVAIRPDLGPPIITQQPQDVSPPAGTSASFSVAAIRNKPPGYQWFFDGRPLPGATNSSLALNNVQRANNGPYQVKVYNALGAVTSVVATLSVKPALPVMTLQPRSQAAFPELSAGFSVSATGSEPFRYQWQLNGSNVRGATNSYLWLPRVRTEDTGLYRAVVSNEAGNTLSDEALLALVPVAAWGWSDYGQTNLLLELTNTVQIAAGERHNVALQRDGSVLTWGNKSTTPASLTNAVAVAAGGSHNLALTSDGRVMAWGNNGSGQANVPTDLSNVAAVAAGGAHSLALTAEGLVEAWGSGSREQTSVPFDLVNVVGIAAGRDHSLALRADGKVIAWGDNRSGQTQVPGTLADVVAIAAGGAHNLALRIDGTVVAWGTNDYGQTDVPPGLSNVVAVAAGSYHSLAIKSDGILVGWGAGGPTNSPSYPQCGQLMIPRTATNLSSVSAGEGHTLALVASGAPFLTEPPVSRSVYTGGRVVFRAAATGVSPLSYQWQLQGTNLPGATNQILVLEHAFAESEGDYQVVVSNTLGTALSRKATLTLVNQAPFVVAQPKGQLACFGSRAVLQVKADGTAPFSYQWLFNGAAIPGATNATLTLDKLLMSQAGDYSVAISNICGAVVSHKARLDISQVLAWGESDYGQRDVPAGLSGVVHVVGGAYHCLALRADGTVEAWGAGKSDLQMLYEYGQSIVPDSLNDAVDIAAGDAHSLALRANGTVVVWGDNSYGQLEVPAGLNNVVAVAAGWVHNLALRSDGRVVIWGGEGYPTVMNIPPGATNLIAIAASGFNNVALRADGRLFRWGDRSIVPGIAEVVSIAVTDEDCMALRSTGGIVLWEGISQASSLSNIVQIAAGYGRFLVLDTDNTIVTFAKSNPNGPNGAPAGWDHLTDVGAGGQHSLAVTGDGSAVIKLSPTDQTVSAGAPTMFRVAAGGDTPLRYQWQLNGTDLPGATNALLRLESTSLADAGQYRVIVTNAYGAETSRLASLTVALPLTEALNAPGLKWNLGNNGAWLGQTEISHDGVHAAQSGRIGDIAASSIWTTVTGPGTLTFWWKVSSEQWFDYLSFSVDNAQQGAISGEVDWQFKEVAVPPGIHTLKWTYAKDSGTSAGSDAAWLDQVEFKVAPPVILVHPQSQTVSMGAPVNLGVSASGAPPLSYQWLRDGSNVPSATGPHFEITRVTRHDSAAYVVAVSNGGGIALSSNAILRVLAPQKLNSPGFTQEGVLTLLSGDADGAALWPSDVVAFEAQVSTNLQDWAPLMKSLHLTNGSLRLLDPDVTNSSARFYRILEKQP